MTTLHDQYGVKVELAADGSIWVTADDPEQIGAWHGEAERCVAIIKPACTELVRIELAQGEDETLARMIMGVVAAAHAESGVTAPGGGACVWGPPSLKPAVAALAGRLMQALMPEKDATK